MAAIERIWYSDNLFSRALQPLASLVGALARRRRAHYLAAVAEGRLWRPPVPVIVVGNINVGGTGKTPVVIALVEYLGALGYRPGVVARGYGGRPDHLPLEVNGETPAQRCGDEPLLIHLRTACPVVIDPDRPRAVKHLLDHSDCDVIISDDGLQHYPLYRDIELVVVDGERGLGNGLCLPAGPLRESPSRLAEVDAVLVNGAGQSLPGAASHDFYLKPRAFVQLRSGERCGLEAFPGVGPVHALAGIGNPARFFGSLRDMGFELLTHEFTDHFSYTKQDIEFNDNKYIIMTEKDAVKCRDFATEKHWYLAVDAELPEAFLLWLEQKLRSLNKEN